MLKCRPRPRTHWWIQTCTPIWIRKWNPSRLAPQFITSIWRRILGWGNSEGQNVQSIIRLVRTHKWDELKLISKYYYSLRNDLSVAQSGCLLYDGKLVMPYQLLNLVINAVHRTHPSQVGMIRLANLIWIPQIHRTIALRADNCRQCLDQGKNLIPIIPKSKLGQLPKLSEHNEKIQLDFPGPIVDTKNFNNEHHILAVVDWFSRYPSAVAHKNCDAQTATEFLNQYCKFHGIPRSIRCDQGQALKSRTFEIYCEEKNIKLNFSPTHDHRASDMVERLIQILKRRLATMNVDPIWDNTTIAEKISEIIESIRLNLNRVTKIPPFEAHFGRPKNLELSNLLTNPNTINLTYNNIKSFYLDKRLLQNPTMTPATKGGRDTNSEVNLDIQYIPEDTTRQDPPSEESKTSDSSDSDNAPLKPTQKGTIIPSKFKFQIGNKTTIIDQTRRNLARKTNRRKKPETRGTLKPLWSIIPYGTIVDYTPHTITIDTYNRKNTVIRNNDIAKSSIKRQLPHNTKPQETILRFINFVACKTVGEYNRNKRKIEKFCFAEKAETAKTSRTGQPTKNAGKEAPSEPQPNSKTRNQNTTMDAPGPSCASHQHGTSTPIDEDDNTTPVTKATLNISPIMTKAHPSPAQKKSKKKPQN